MRKGSAYFTDNFVFPDVEPHSRFMYDPNLQIRVEIGTHHEATNADVPIDIFYDPEIASDQVTAPVSEETRAFWRLRPRTRHKAEDESLRFPFKSEKSVKIANLNCRWQACGSVARLKVSGDAEIFLLVIERIQSSELPNISENPSEFVLWVVSNFIRIPDLANRLLVNEEGERFEMVEICLRTDAVLKAFRLSAADFEEVEQGWFKISSRDLKR